MGGIYVDFSVVNQLNSPALNSNTFANRPSAGQAGRLFVSTDTFEIYRDNGTSWDLIGGPGTSTITGTGTPGTLPKFTGLQSIGDSIVSEGTNLINIGGTNSRLVLSGTDDGSSQLQTYSNTQTRWKFQVSSNNPIDDADITGYRTRGTIAAPTAILQGDAITNYFGSGYDGTNFQSSGGFEIFAAENFSPTAGGTDISILTTSIGATGANEKVRISANGFVGINAPVPAGYLHINGGANITRAILDADNNIARLLSFRTGGSQRWAFRVDGNETGGDTGANFTIRRYDDTGTFIDAPLHITRSSGNVGIQVTPNAWNTTNRWALQIASASLAVTKFNDDYLSLNANTFLNNAGNYIRINNGFATRYEQVGGDHQWLSVGTGNAGDVLTFGIPKMTLKSNGDLGIGTATVQARLQITGGFTSFDYNNPSGYPIFNAYRGAISSNFSNGNNELNIWNTVSGGFSFHRQTGVGAQTTLLNITSGGNVLIGSNTDNGNRLQVTGNIFASGNAIATSLNLGMFTPFNAKINIGLSGSNAGVKTWIVTGNANEGTVIDSYVDSGGTGTRYTDFVALGHQDAINGGSEIRFLTNPNGSGTAVSRLNITKNGNIGINTPAPNRLLEITDSALTTSTIIPLGINGGGVSILAGFISNGTNITNARIRTSANTPLSLGTTSANDALWINNNGNICIGTTTDAGQKLQVNGTSYLNGNVGIGTTSTTFRVNISDTFQDYTSGLFNVEILTTTPQSEGRGGSIGFSGQTGGGPESFACIYGGKANNTFAETGGRLGLMTRSNGGPMSERLRIKPNGQTRFIPLAADPAGAEAGDVYYNSGTNKLRLYDGTNWVDLN